MLRHSFRLWLRLLQFIGPLIVLASSFAVRSGQDRTNPLHDFELLPSDHLLLREIARQTGILTSLQQDFSEGEIDLSGDQIENLTEETTASGMAPSQVIDSFEGSSKQILETGHSTLSADAILSMNKNLALKKTSLRSSL